MQLSVMSPKSSKSNVCVWMLVYVYLCVSSVCLDLGIVSIIIIILFKVI